MLDILTRVSTLRRPKLLARAAQVGMRDYKRTRHLRRVLQIEALPRHADALIRLSEIEADLNDKRLACEAGYSIPRHVEVLIAIAGEAELLRQSSARLSLVQ